jgi:hypothetical protein
MEGKFRMATAPKFRIDVDIHNLLMSSAPGPVLVPKPKQEASKTDY